MCELCKIVDNAIHNGETEYKIHHVDGLCAIADSLGDKPKKDGFQPKVVVYRQHLFNPLPPIVDAIIETAERLFRGRTLWFPQTTDGKRYTLGSNNKRPLAEWSAHWYFIIE